MADKIDDFMVSRGISETDPRKIAHDIQLLKLRLNTLMRDAVHIGLRVDVDVIEYQLIEYPYPTKIIDISVMQDVEPHRG